MTRLLIYLVVCTCTFFVAAEVARADKEEVAVRDYVVKKGDTCIRIAKRELGSRKAYRLIHKHNPNMGKTPHRLKAGSVLVLPVLNKTPDAHVTDRRGTVKVRKPAAEDWLSANKGMPLFRSWRVNSREKSSAELTFADNSSIHLRENTVVIVYGPSSSRAKKATAYASLERGTLRTRLGEFDRKRPVVVQTPGSEAELSDGSAVVSVDDGGTSRVANHAGGSVKVRSRGKRSRSVAVAVGMGSKVKKNKPPEKPRPLPPTPIWQKGSRHVVGHVATGGTLRGKWAPVKEAKHYRVEIAIDPIARAVVASVIVPSAVSEFEASGLPPGDYYTSVSAIDDDKFESIPSPRETMKISAFEVDGGSSGKLGATLRVVSGSTLRATGNIKCSQGDLEPATETLVATADPLRCFDGDLEIPAQPVELVPIRAMVASSRTLLRDKTETIEISLAADGLPLPRLGVKGNGIAVREFKQSKDKMLVTVVAGADGGESATLRVHSLAAPSVALATLDVEIAKVEPPPPPVVAAPFRPKWELGVFTGIGSGDRDFGVVGGLEPLMAFGGRVGYRLIDRLALEIEGSYAGATARGDATEVDSITARGQLRLDVLAGQEMRLHFLAGPAAQIVRDGSTASELGGSYGAGVRIKPTTRSELRLEARHLLMPAQGVEGLASQFEAQLGVSLLF